MASMRSSLRTQSKSKVTVTDKPSSLEETYNQFSHKASWDSASILVFLQLIANEITKGNRPFLVLSQAGKGVPGIGFDCDTGMFQAPEEWWDKMESVSTCTNKPSSWGHQLLVSTIGPRERNFLKLLMTHLIQCIVWEPSHLLIRYP
ncbi:hypothetical protein CsSME_00031597 [Camellia sinensis var. sinensis]